jgi:hypothetical protein
MSDITSFKRERICPICHKQNYVQVDLETHEKGMDTRAIMKVKCDNCSYEIPFEASSIGLWGISILAVVGIIILTFSFFDPDPNNVFEMIGMFTFLIIAGTFIGIYLPLQLMDWYMKRYLSGKKLDKIIIDEHEKSKSRIK